MVSRHIALLSVALLTACNQTGNALLNQAVSTGVNLANGGKPTPGMAVGMSQTLAQSAMAPQGSPQGASVRSPVAGVAKPITAPMPTLAPVTSEITEPQIRDSANYGYSASEKARVRDWLKKAYAIVRPVPLLNPVRGYYGGMWMGIGDTQGQEDGSPLRGVIGFTMLSAVPDPGTGRYKPGYDRSNMELWFNGIDLLFEGLHDRRDGSGAAATFPEPEYLGDLNGFPVFQKAGDQYLVISRFGRDLYRPVGEGRAVTRPELTHPTGLRTELRTIIIKMRDPFPKGNNALPPDRNQYLSNVRSEFDLQALYRLLD